jgi:hypothetical protein
MSRALSIWCCEETTARRATTSATRVAAKDVSKECLHVLSSKNATQEREIQMPEAVLPRLSTNDTTAQLPSDPNDLLSAAEHHELTEDLAKLADLRRDAETESASLRLA